MREKIEKQMNLTHLISVLVLILEQLFYLCFAVTKDMDLQPNCGSDRAWVWKADDYADEALKRETLAIRFANAESELFSKFMCVVVS